MPLWNKLAQGATAFGNIAQYGAMRMGGRVGGYLSQSPLRAGLAAAGAGVLGISALGGVMGGVGPGTVGGGAGGIWTGGVGGAMRGGMAGAMVGAGIGTYTGYKAGLRGSWLAANAGRVGMRGGLIGAGIGLGLGALTGGFGGGLNSNRAVNRIQGLRY
jgi:hypothetical protein